jgi:dihydroorotate dehydrogenase electron transfer subunit
MLQFTATLAQRTISGPGQELTLVAPELARQLGAGQAVLIRCGWGAEPYLRRTFYPVAIDAESWRIRLLPGPDWGHAWLAAAAVGAEVDCLGPVGNGFSLAPGVRNLLCVGEGEGAWTLPPLARQADAAGVAVALAAGAVSQREALPAGRLPAAVEYHLVTADGRPNLSAALTSVVSDLLPWADAVCAAGPASLFLELAAAIRAVRYGLSPGFAQALYPATFLCGVGACQACVADVAGGRRRVCLRGPVCDLAELAPP